MLLKIKQNIPYLKGLNDTQLKILYYKSKRKFIEMDNKLFEYGDQCKHISIILSGMLCIEIVNNKKDVKQEIDILGRGSIIGQNNIINKSQWFYRARVCSQQSLQVI